MLMVEEGRTIVVFIDASIGTNTLLGATYRLSGLWVVIGSSFSLTLEGEKLTI